MALLRVLFCQLFWRFSEDWLHTEDPSYHHALYNHFGMFCQNDLRRSKQLLSRHWRLPKHSQVSQHLNIQEEPLLLYFDLPLLWSVLWYASVQSKKCIFFSIWINKNIDAPRIQSTLLLVHRLCIRLMNLNSRILEMLSSNSSDTSSLNFLWYDSMCLLNLPQDKCLLFVCLIDTHLYNCRNERC